jgi:hypothetical protein
MDDGLEAARRVIADDRLCFEGTKRRNEEKQERIVPAPFEFAANSADLLRFATFSSKQFRHCLRDIHGAISAYD